MTTEIIIPEPKLRNGYHGKTVETLFKDVLGFDWELTTMKRYNGAISTSYSAGHARSDENFDVFESSPFDDPNGTLNIERKARATEKKLMEMHKEGVKIFLQRVEDKTILGK